MEPKLAQKLMKNKEMHDFVSFLGKEIEKLNTITDFDDDIDNIELEVRARKLAINKLATILTPLLNSREEEKTFNKLEYLV